MVIHSEVPLDPDSRDRALQILAEMATKSRAEAGVVDYRVTVDIEEPNTARIIEQYEDRAAVEAHESSSHLAWFQDAIEPHMSGEPELFRFDVTAKVEAEGP